MLRFVDQFCHMQQPFGGDAAAQGADASQARFLVDQSDLVSQVSGIERGGISARTGADDGDMDLGGCFRREPRVGVYADRNYGRGGRGAAASTARPFNGINHLYSSG